MTRDEILNMPAGREMDALIAERVMKLKIRKAEKWKGNMSVLGGFNSVEFSGEWTIDRDWVEAGDYVVIFEDGQLLCVPNYSTDIGAAWDVVRELQVEPYAWQFEAVNIENGKSYEAILWGGNDEPFNYENDARANTMQLAICRAALLAVMK